MTKPSSSAQFFDFTGRTVLIVGGSGEIGSGIARAFGDCGASVHVTGTRPSPGDYNDGNFGEAVYHQLDLSQSDAMSVFSPGFDSLDVLVCAQGIARYGRKEFELETFRNVIELNLVSVMACCLRFHPHLVSTKGSILLLSSGAAFKANRANPAYSASKGALRTLTMTLAEAWAAEGLRVNALAPGYVASKLTDPVRQHPRRYEESLKSIPLGRWGDADEIGRLAVFLASPLADYVTGQTLLADGGKMLS